MIENRPMVVVVCACGHKMKAPAAIVGKTTQCLKCGKRFTVTQGNSHPLESPDKEQTSTKAPSPLPTPPAQKRPRVHRMLLEAGLVTEQQLLEAETEKEQHGGRVIDILLERKQLTKTSLIQLLNQQTGLPSIDLKNFQISSKIVSLIPRDFAYERMVLPIDRIGNILTVAVAVADDTETIQMVERMTRLRVTAMLCRLDELDAAIERYFPTTSPEEEEEHNSWGFGTPTKTPPCAPAPKPEPPRVEVTAPPPQPGTPAPPSTPTEENMRQHDRALAWLTELSALPASPVLADRLETVTQDPHFPARDLVTICATEPAVVGKLLSIANAAAYGMPDKVDNVYLAGALLGTPGMSRVIRMCLPPATPEAPVGFDYERFSLCSRFCAAVAQSIARAGGEVPFATAMTAGLLYRVGELALAIVLPKEVKTLTADWASPELPEQQMKTLGITYNEAGGALLRAWRIPERLAEAVRLHGYTERAAEQDPLAAVVAAAALMTTHGLKKNPPVALTLPQKLLAAIHVSLDECKQILSDTLTTFQIS